MRRVMDWFVDAWDWARRVMGFDRLGRARRGEDLQGRTRLGRIIYFGRPALAALLLLYFVSLTLRFSVIYGDTLNYPQALLAEQPAGTPGSRLPGGGCAPSAIITVTAGIIDILTEQNAWAPGDPQYKIGWFGVAGFAGGPFFDNKASFQVGALRAVRRFSVELADLLGRARGTSAADIDLTDARGGLQFNERAWVVNPLDSRLPLLSASASASYRDASARMRAYNDRLAACNALFDARSDNLYQLLDRVANEIGGMTDQLAQRSKGDRWDPSQKAMVPADGNNLGFFDFRADNLFYEAHGLMWAYHGLLQAARVDFAEVVSQSNLDAIWDRMESHIAESAALEPLIVSNGREDSIFQPDHLSAMAANMLRARANMTELREVLNR